MSISSLRDPFRTMPKNLRTSEYPKELNSHKHTSKKEVVFFKDKSRNITILKTGSQWPRSPAKTATTCIVIKFHKRIEWSLLAENSKDGSLGWNLISLISYIIKIFKFIMKNLFKVHQIKSN